MPPSVGVLAPADAGTCILTSGADSLDMLIFHIAAMDLDFTVLEPPEFIERAMALAARLASAAPKGGQVASST